MPTPTKGPRLGGSPSHQRIILDNLASQLFEHGRITTTETKAKRVRPLAEKLITKAKVGDLHNRRQVATHIRDKGVLHVLFTEIAPALAERDGGYTRITKIGPRKGDNAPMAIIEVITEAVNPAAKPARAQKTTAAPTSAAPTSGAPASAAPASAAPTSGATAAGSQPAVVVADDSAGESSTDVADYGDNAFRGDNPPEGFDVKGNEDSMTFHTSDSQWYDQTVAEVWFNSAEAAEAAGFTRVRSDNAG